MTTTSRFGALSKTQTGRTGQINRAFRGMADEMKAKQSMKADDCNEPQTLEQYRLLVASLQNRLDDAEDLIEDMRANANSDAPVATVNTTKYWSTERMAKESGVAVCTICRNADALNGIKVGGVWLFPAGIKYGKKRKRN